MLAFSVIWRLEKPMWTATILTYIYGALTLLLGIFLGYFKGYTTKKGENLATHEDIDKLVDQMKAVTEATKKIGADISTGVWDKQKRWEMKREVLFEAAKRLSEVDDALLSYATVMREDQAKQKAWAAVQPSVAEELSFGELKDERLNRWLKASTTFTDTRLFVGIVCGKDGKEAFEDLGAFVNTLAGQMTKDPDVYQTSSPDLIKKILLARNAIRKELEVDT
jgi:hypothetical protein